MKKRRYRKINKEGTNNLKDLDNLLNKILPILKIPKNNMKIKEIKSMKDVFKYFGVKSTKKAIESIKDSKLSTDTKKSLSFKIFQGNKETKNNKKTEKVYNEYLSKSKVEKKITDKLKEKYNVTNKKELKKISKEDIRKTKIKNEYVTIKEKGKKAYEVKKPFTEKIEYHPNSVFDIKVIAKVKENNKFRYITIPISDRQYKQSKLQDKYTNFKMFEGIAQNRKQRYMNLSSKPDIQIMKVEKIVIEGSRQF